MKQSTSPSLLSTAALLPTVLAQIVPIMPGPGMDPMAMDPMCLDNGAQTIIYEYPVFYSTVYQSVGTIFSFLGGTNSLVINNPGQTIVTSTVLTTTVVATSTTTQTVTAGGSGGTKITATLGAGIPSGTVSSIPSNSPFAIAFALSASGGAPDGYAADGGLGTVTDADFFYLEGGEMPSVSGGKVGRNITQSMRRRQDTDTIIAKIEASFYQNDITTDFYLVDGVLNWDSPDRGPATFYVCDDGLYAGFPDAPPGTCAQALVGAVSRVNVDIEIETGANATDPTSTSDGGDGSSGSATTSTDDSGTTSDTSATSTDDSSSTTTDDSSPTTTTSGADPTGTPGDGGVCPGQDPADDYYGYSVYCGQAVDPVDPDDDLIPGGQSDIASFDDCTLLCDGTDGCTGLSYYVPDSICYIHKGDSQEPREAPGYDGAVKNGDGGNDGGDNGGDSSSTTSTTSQDSSTTSGSEAATTSASGVNTSGSAASSTTSPAMSSSSASGSSTSAASSSTSASGSAGSAGTSSATSSSMAAGSSTSSTGGAGSTGASGASSSSTAPTSTMSGTSNTGSAGTSSTTSNSPYSNSTSAVGGSTTSTGSTMSGTKTTTSSSSASTTPADLCPSTPSGAVVGGYQIYCGYVVDPVSGADNEPQVNPISFQGCLDKCTADSTCVGLSYIESDTTCYMHRNQNMAPVAKVGWRGAAKVGAGTTSTTTTMMSTSISSSMSSTTQTTTASGASTSSSGATTSSVSGSSSSTSSGSSSTTSGSTTTTTGLPGVTTPGGLLGTTSSSTTTTSTTTMTTTTSTTTNAPTTTTTSTTTTTTTAPAATTTSASSGSTINNPPAGGPQDDKTSANHQYCLQNCPTDKSQVQSGYRIYNAKTWGGAAFDSSPVADFAACVNLCSTTANCVGANYDNGAKYCYLHNDCHNAETEQSGSALTSAERVASDCPALT